LIRRNRIRKRRKSSFFC